MKLDRTFTSDIAVQALQAGHRVRFIWWPDSYYIQISHDARIESFPFDFEEFVNENPWRIMWMLLDKSGSKDWEEYTGKEHPKCE